MRIIEPDQIGSLLAGHVSVVAGAAGTQPLRLVASEAHLYDSFNRLAAAMTSGVRLRLITDSTRIVVRTTQHQTYVTKPGEWTPFYDLFVDGEPVKRTAAVGGAQLGPSGVSDGDAVAVLALDNLRPGTKHVELWLPMTALVTISAIELDEGAGYSPWPDERPRLLFHGSSITHGVGANAAIEAWPAVAARLANAHMVNLGWAGSCLVSGLAGRIIRDQPADLIVLELGINVHGDGLLKERTFLSSVHSLLSIIRERHAATPLVLVSPIYCAFAENTAQGDGLTLIQMRALLAQVAHVWNRAGDSRVFHVSGLDLLGADDAGDLPDGLHPSTEGHAKIGARLHARVSSLPHR
jgi:lysophospholipase L1-like esterase